MDHKEFFNATFCPELETERRFYRHAQAETEMYRTDMERMKRRMSAFKLPTDSYHSRQSSKRYAYQFEIDLDQFLFRDDPQLILEEVKYIIGMHGRIFERDTAALIVKDLQAGGYIR